MANTIQISNEIEAAALIERLLHEPDTIDPNSIIIKGWENFTIHLSGEKFHNSITPTVMKGFLSLQTALYKSYCIARYQDANPNRLTQEERKALELSIIVDEGSSNFILDVDEWVSKILELIGEKMSSKQIFALILISTILYFGNSAFTTWIEKEKNIKIKELESDDAFKSLKILAENHKHALEVIQDMARNNPQAREILQISQQAKRDILKSTRDADTVTINNAIEISGEAAELLAKETKEDWQSARLDGYYRLLSVDSSNTEERKARIRKLDTGEEVTALLEISEADSRALLSKAEWNFHPVYLRVIALKKDNKIKEKSARIIAVDKIDDKTIFNDRNEE